MLPTDRTRVDYICLKFLHELTEPLTAIACHTAAVRRLSTLQGSNSPAKIADSLEQIPLEMTRASDVIKRFRSYLQKEAKQQLDSIENTGDAPNYASSKPSKVSTNVSASNGFSR
jgi:hypothetical protein